MRRKELESDDSALLEELLAQESHGTLSLCEGNIPYGVVLNYLYHEGIFYFHGAQEGRKMGIINNNPHASLSVVRAMGFVPSYMRKSTSACAASYEFVSAHIQGTIALLNEPVKKCEILTLLMQKLQPEGGYTPLEPTDSSIAKTALFCLMPSDISLKVKTYPKESL